MPGYAGGTNYAESGLALVGEKGPELVRMSGGEQVYNAAETKAILSGGGSYETHITIAPQFMVSGGANVDESTLREWGKKLAEMVKEELREEEIDRRRSAYI